MKKKQLLALAVIVSVVVGISSCNNKEFENLPSQRTEVLFSTNIETRSPGLRASDNTWGTLDEIGIYMYTAVDTEVVEEVQNIPYFTEAGGETGSFIPQSTVIYFPDNGDKVRFMAYYPYLNSVSANNDVFNVDVSDQTSQPDIDLLYSFNTTAEYDKTVSGKKVALVFTHQLTKVYVHVKADEGLTNSEIQNVTTSFLGFNTKANFDLAAGSLSDPSESQPISLKQISTEDTYAASFEAIVLPVTDVSSAQILFDLNNGDEGQSIASDKFTWNFDQPLLPSTKYTFNVKIKRSGIVVEATITPWINGGDKEVTAE